MNYIKVYLLALSLFFLIDLVWLGLIAKDFYRNQIGFLMSDTVRWLPALLFYALYIFGLLYFSIIPSDSAIKAAISGALFGLICYATYDLTNYATLKDWPLKMVVYDLIWGTIISSFVAFCIYLISNRWQII